VTVLALLDALISLFTPFKQLLRPAARGIIQKGFIPERELKDNKGSNRLWQKEIGTRES
jgi:hypothetical protein